MSNAVYQFVSHQNDAQEISMMSQEISRSEFVVVFFRVLGLCCTDGCQQVVVL